MTAPGRPPLAEPPVDPSALGLEVAAAEAPEPVTPLRLREALGRFATGVTIITCVDAQGESVGLTANSFNALSLDPPLVLWSLRLQSVQLAAFQQAGGFVVNVLARAQLENASPAPPANMTVAALPPQAAPSSSAPAATAPWTSVSRS